MHWPNSLTDLCVKILSYFKNKHTYRSRCVTERKNRKYRKIRGILHNLKTADRIWGGFSLNNRHKRAENMPDISHVAKFPRRYAYL